jgi:outer membrane protein OmpA-like peptidoglycan-associated protein
MRLVSGAIKRGLSTSGAALLVLCCLAGPAAAYFFDYGDGVRPTGLGRAFVAVADDANAINWNPAGLVLMDRYEITTMFSSLFAGFDGRLYGDARDVLGYSYVGVAIPVDPTVGYFGASWAQFGSALYHENTFVVGYARTLTYEGESLHVGANLKIMSWDVTAGTYSPAMGKTGFTADLAALYPLPEKFMLGIAVENIIPANVGVDTYEEVPRIFRLGASWRQDLQPLGSVVDNILVSTEFNNRSYAQNTNTLHLGVESWFFDGLAAARMGVNSTEFTISLSGRYGFQDLNKIQLQVDYSFSLPFYVQKTYGTHRVALTGSWGKLAGTRVERAEKALADAIVNTEGDENMAKKRDQEFASARAQEQAKLDQIMAQLKQDVVAGREGLQVIDQKIKAGQLPAIQFESGKAVLLPTSLPTLNEMGAFLEKYPQLKVRLSGHTDSKGKPKANLELSQARVEAVREYLVALYKVKTQNLIPVGFGDTRPIADNATAAGRAANRRVEIQVLVPTGMETEETGTVKPGLEDQAGKEPLKPEDIVPYEEIEKQREKLKVFELQTNPAEVEELLRQQHKQNGVAP